MKRRISLDIVFLIIFLFLASLIYSFISINVHNQYLTFSSDLGTFDEWIWKISRFKFPYGGAGCNWILEDHFQLILYIFAPLYWIWDDVRVLLVSQSYLMVYAGLPLYLLSKKVTNHKIFSFSVVFSYLFFLGTQFSILNEFHQVTIAPLFLAFAFYGLHVKNIRYFVYSIIGLLITKEDLSLLVSSIGIGLIFHKEYRKIGILITAVGIIFFFFLLYFYMPLISLKGVYDHFDFGEAGFTPIDVLKKLITDPLFLFRTIIYSPVKLKTIFQSFFTFSFLPLFSPLVYLMPLIQDFVTRFIYGGPQFTKWALVNHHAAPSAMLLSITTIYGASSLVKLFFRNNGSKTYLLLSIFLITTTVSSDIFFHGPVNSVLKSQFYEKHQWVKDNDDVLEKIPKDISVAAQNNLVPHLTHRDSIYRIPFGLNSQYMVVDLHDGPNKYAPFDLNEMKDFVNNLLTTRRYSIVYQKGQTLLLKRNFKTDITKSKYYNDTRYCYYSFEER